MASQIMLPVLLLGMIISAAPQSTTTTAPQTTSLAGPSIPIPTTTVITVTRPLYPIEGTRNPTQLDGSSPRIPLQRPFVYFGRTYNQIYVNNNGHLTFNSSWYSYIAERIPVRGSRDFIAPFWTDFDHRVTGQVIYNQYTSGSILGQATEDINRYFPALNFRANWVFVATWYQVAYYPFTGTQTTVQAVLISGGQYSFVLMNYGIIAFTTHGVQAGYDTENSTHHFSIPGSFSDTATGINSTFPLSSNVNVTGRWAFRLDGGLRNCTFKAGESFWTDDCAKYCECHGPNDLRCYAASCTPTQECTIRNGQLGCFDPMSTCTAWGDPHYITFDGAVAHFQGTCSYIITESVNHGPNETQFQVVATNSHRGNNRVSFVSAVDIYLSNQRESVHIRIGPNNIVKVNGSAVSLPTTAGTLAQVVRQGGYIVVDAINLVVHFDARSTLLVRVHYHCQNRVTGMCGNLNSDPADDKVLPNGTLAQNDNHFGHSWISPTSQPGCGSTDDVIGDGLDNCRFRAEYSQLCSVITNSSGPFSACHPHSDPQPFFSSCVYDLCLYTKANGILCSDVAAYEKTCSVLGLNISDWRSALYCPESDPCDQLDCAEHEWCGEKDGVYGCFCDEHHHRPNNMSYDSSISCNNSSGTMSVSRCQLFEAGFHPGALHLQDHSCNGTVEDGRLVFHFNNEDKLCGTTLRSNGTHFTYANVIQGDVDTHGSPISRERNIHLRFCCEYPLWQALSMDVGINPVESIVRKKLPSGRGRCYVRMIPYQDSGFRYPMTTNMNIDMEIDQRLYVELRTEGVDGRQISTVVESCWATPSNVTSSPVRWDLITEMQKSYCNFILS
ncbi:alpha-tectorin-like [Sebastes fasciatus]|uniref:alpha-tectorin-like n=1 Tax=Sebastes fasciatus TaxID=394691 RepID=UPI003D9DB31F